VNFLLEHKREEDQIVVLMDLEKSDLYEKIPEKELVHEFIMQHHSEARLQVAFRTLNNDFATFKNHVIPYCTGDYIFFIDADEIPSEDLIQTLPEILEMNPEMDIFLVPRVNTVESLLPEHIANWGWNVTKLESVTGEKTLDLSNPQDLKEYEFLKDGGFIIEEFILE
jgi:glycosyltransferase involved in cell wall biosynthesis